LARPEFRLLPDCYTTACRDDADAPAISLATHRAAQLAKPQLANHLADHLAEHLPVRPRKEAEKP